MALEEKYAWLAKESGPLMLKKALELYGTLESAGSANNPVITNWAKEVGGTLANLYKADEIPWCGLFIAVVAKRSSKHAVKGGGLSLFVRITLILHHQTKPT